MPVNCTAFGRLCRKKTNINPKSNAQVVSTSFPPQILTPFLYLSPTIMKKRAVSDCTSTIYFINFLAFGYLHKYLEYLAVILAVRYFEEIQAERYHPLSLLYILQFESGFSHSAR